MEEVDVTSYDRIVVACSGGKDSVAALLTVLKAGASPDRIELHHHDVDGRGPPFMDWPCSSGYCRALARAFDLPLLMSWKEGGFLREMLRHDAATAPIAFEMPDGSVRSVGGEGPMGTRLRFPQVSADLRVRWCSPYLKIGPMDAFIRGQERFLGARTLIVTGERAEESRARAGYPVFAPHRTDARHSTRLQRHVDHWRPVHALDEAAVWKLIRHHGIRPAPAYRLGWSRFSCITCIFGGADQWATLNAIAPRWFGRIAAYERRFGTTIQRAHSVEHLAARGRPYPAALSQPELVAQALSCGWDENLLTSPEAWTLPAGAFGSSLGPT